MNLIILTPDLINEAKKSTELKFKHLFHGHTFGENTDSVRYNHLYRGKLGEKVLKKYLLDKGIDFIETNTPPEVPDVYDFMINGMSVDVKVVQDFHKYLLEKQSTYEFCPKTVYVAVRLNKDLTGGEILGWVKGETLAKNKGNVGYVDDLCVKLVDLVPIEELERVLIP